MATLDIEVCDLNLIGIIGGTGQFGRAIGKRLLTSGYHVIVGSRKPDSRDLGKRDAVFTDVRVCSIEECITSVKTLILCIRKKHFNTLLSYQSLLSGKVVIDATNQDRRDKNESNTDYLRTMFPEAIFCKAFNTISAYNMSRDEYCQEGMRIPVASDSTVVRHALCEMIRYMGFTPVDIGRIHHAKHLEKSTMRILSGWGGSFLFGAAIFLVWLLHGLLLYFIRSSTHAHDRNFMKVWSKASAMTAVTLLSATFIAGCFANFTTLRNGTMRKPFARWLDKWLRARKSLALLSMYYATMHVFSTFILMGPTTYRSWYSTDGDELFMIWQADAAQFFGMMTYIAMICMSIAAIPSVSEAVNWREWRFMKFTMGYMALILCIVHISFAGAAFWSKLDLSQKLADIFIAVPLHSLILPSITVILKLILIFPCVTHHLRQIEEGLDREHGQDATETSETSTGKRSAQSRRRSDVKSSHAERSTVDDPERPKERTREKRETRERSREEGVPIRERSKEDRRSERGSRSKARTQDRESKRTSRT